MLTVQLSCSKCDRQTCCSAAEIEQRLRSLGLLRRAPDPPPDLVSELLAAHACRLKCDVCGAVGLAVGKPVEDDCWGDWQQVVVCEVCKKPIPAERVEVFPDAKRCVDCQGIADRGEDVEEPEFCPKCGSLVELRVSRGAGITRYKRFCTGNPACRL